MKKASIITALMFIGISIFIFLNARHFPGSSNGVPGPGFFPMVLSAIVVLLSVLLIINECRNHNKEHAASLNLFARENLRVWVALGMTALYIVLINWIGFIVITPIFLFSLMRFFKVKKIGLNIAISVLTTAFLYTVFTILLAVQLPSGILI